MGLINISSFFRNNELDSDGLIEGSKLFQLFTEKGKNEQVKRFGLLLNLF